jgi:AcrR family transcriptional regulator
MLQYLRAGGASSATPSARVEKQTSDRSCQIASTELRNRSGARGRILDTAYDLFSHEGIRAVGIDRIIAESGVAKMSFYRHFPSKDTLVVAFLELREKRWTNEWLAAEVLRRSTSPSEQLLSIFDVFNDWFQCEDFEGCAFISVLLETNEKNEVRHASQEGLEHIRDFIRRLAAEAGVGDPDRLARQWHILMKGSIVAAQEGDREAAVRARDVAELLLRRELGAY